MKDDLFPRIGPHFPDREGDPVNLISERIKVPDFIEYCTQVGKTETRFAYIMSFIEFLIKRSRKWDRQFYHMWE